MNIASRRVGIAASSLGLLRKIAEAYYEGDISQEIWLNNLV